MVKEHVIAWRRATLFSLCTVLDIDLPLKTGQFLQTTQENTTKLAYEGKIHCFFTVSSQSEAIYTNTVYLQAPHG